MDELQEMVVQKVMSQLELQILYCPLRKFMYRYNDKETKWHIIDKEDFCWYTILFARTMEWNKQEQRIITNETSSRRISKHCYLLCLRRNDTDIVSQLNLKKGCLALPNNMLVELRTLTVRPRVATDYFTENCTATYNPQYNKERIYRILASIFCLSYNDLTRELTEEELAVVTEKVKLLGYVMTAENVLNMKEYEENENNTDIMVAAQRAKRKELQEQYHVYNWTEKRWYAIIFYYFYISLGELCNTDLERYSPKQIKSELRESNFRMIALPNTYDIEKMGVIQGCVPFIRQDNQFGIASFKKVELPFYFHKGLRDEYDEFATDFLSVCCEGAQAYYQEEIRKNKEQI